MIYVPQEIARRGVANSSTCEKRKIIAPVQVQPSFFNSLPDDLNRDVQWWAFVYVLLVFVCVRLHLRLYERPTTEKCSYILGLFLESCLPVGLATERGVNVVDTAEQYVSHSKRPQ